MSLKDLKDYSLNQKTRDDNKFNSGLEIYARKKSNDKDTFTLFSNTTLKSLSGNKTMALEFKKEGDDNVK